ncbi:MAG: hypothetical protein AB1461_18465 [Thermodesulfobacteriota bacterium]
MIFAKQTAKKILSPQVGGKIKSVSRSYIVIVMPEWFYRASSKNPGFPPNSIAGMTAR